MSTSDSSRSYITYDHLAISQSTVKQNEVVPQRRPLWHVVWVTGRKAIFMIIFTLLAIGLAVTHHLVYQYLEGKPPVKFSQRWTSRFATAIAFAFKSCLTVSVGLAFQEALWAAVRQRFFKIGSLDKLFTVQSNPLSFFCWDAITHGFLPMALAGIAWILPIAVIFTPGTLTVISSITQSFQPCFPPTSISESINTITSSAGPMSTVGSITPLLRNLAAQVVSGGSVVNIMTMPPLPDASNYSYTISFLGPALRCIEQPLPPLNDMNISLLYSGHQVDLGVTVINHVPSLNPSVISYHDQVPSPATERISGLNMAFLGIQESLYAYLTGNVTIAFPPFSTYPFTLNDTTLISTTSLLTSSTTISTSNNTAAYYLPTDLSTKLSELMANLAVSALVRSNITREVTCTITVLENVYGYNQFVLILAYGSAVVLSLVGLFVGIRATYVNGGPTGSTFSQLLVTTRNSTLDKLCKGHSLSSYNADELKKHRLKLGILNDLESGSVLDDSKHRFRQTAFGVQCEVSPITN
ncbi:hypothetical protein PILCRDRAFT_762890 [Piloderma croceum F 1598]|uniref:Uncharacterized protein n=1 Tax=Piloderma croceum (strain F 1598) TaxID=765440 RepID=A0A0C3GIE9_PILCF|nr:hypothetical protein PILCRDRAFT_762890 [Piloderma croceum F 1598]